jgi:tripartite-type tricarboxylate transporter receptor subunit TctC
MPSICVRALFALSAVAVSGAALAQDYPTRPVRILTSTPGGGNDFLARIVAPALGTALGQQVVVDNRTSRLVGGLAARATPDGYTLAIGGGTMQYNPITEDADYNILTDFAPISQLERAPLVLVVHPSLKVGTVKELIAVARTRTLRYGSGSAGKEGRLVALGVTSAQPSALLPGVPPLASQGLKEYDIDTIGFILAPRKTPPNIVQRLNQAVVKIMAQPEVIEKLAAGGSEAVSSTPEQLAAKLKADDAWMREMLVKVGVKKSS